MDGQEYLNQISASVRPEKAQKPGFRGSPIIKIAIIGVVIFVLIATIGSFLGGRKSSFNNKSISLKYHMDTALEVISGYQSKVKSSVLRSDSATLYSIISNTDRDLTSYITDKYGFKHSTKKYKEPINAAAAWRDDINASLFEAKINGILDKVYANKMAYIVSFMMTKESILFDETKDETLSGLLTTSYNSLENLYDKFNDFSGKN